ncbi:MAG: prephenate dehydratase [Leptolyngbyaceae cyanobacterium SM1_1_3]|nr:prephenate dehydratase [Leptolyngbyaceae cyanobacterium SM1_1_3]NJN02015.1 prephenate dehydratase [Leptolyngbyaceae cyanobacterium RM1_1_2]NJO08294.1 prephenate dehydratase [Leptolyngbyaceae cyanobacterium SL_1_1]
MSLVIAHLGPKGTYSEAAALAYAHWLKRVHGQSASLKAYPSITQAIKAVANQDTNLAIVPVENSIEGGVTATLDSLWQLDCLQIQRALVLPILNACLSKSQDFLSIQKVYSHPQALGQCQGWLDQHLPQAQLIPTRSTVDALQYILADLEAAAIASRWAARLYDLPVLACPINDHADNCTKFWVMGLTSSLQGEHTSIAFSLPVNAPGTLLQTLKLFADQNINLSRIESRPTKRSLGDYLFFVDLEADSSQESVQRALESLRGCTETLKIFGSYTTMSVNETDITPIE